MSGKPRFRLYVLSAAAVGLAAINLAEHFPLSPLPQSTSPLIASVDQGEPALLPIAQAEATGRDANAIAADNTRDQSDPWGHVMALEVMRETIERPLFRSSRRPYLAPVPPPATKPLVAAVPAPPPPDPSGLVLVGIVKGRSGALAVLQDKDTGTSKSVRVGESFLGWEVAGVQKTHIVVRQKSVSAELHLFKREE